MSAVPVLWTILRTELFQRAMKTPEFLRDELPSNASSTSKFVQAAGRRACRNYVRAGFGAGTVYGPTYDWACEPYLDTLNEGKLTDGKQDPRSSKDGGQCADKQYKSYLKTRSYTINQQTGAITWGPIAESFADPSLPGYGNLYGPVALNFISAGGSQTYIWKGKYNSSGANSTVGFTPDYGGIVLLGAWVQRADGQVDNCGIPDGYTPPTYPPNLPPIPPPTVAPPGTDNKDWDITVNPDGTLNFCIANICTNLGGPDGPPSNPSEDPGTPNGPPTPSDPITGEAKGCVGDDQILTGIQITFTQTPPVSTTLSGQFYKAPIWVGFGPNLGLIDFVQDGAWVRDGQFIIPNSEFCKCFYVKFKGDFRGTVQPFSRPAEDKKDKEE